MEKLIMELAAKVITVVLRNAFSDPAKRSEVIQIARQLSADISMLLAQIETLK